MALKPSPPPVALEFVPLPDDDDESSFVESQLVRVGSLIRVKRVDGTVVQDAKLLLNTGLEEKKKM